MSAKADTRHAVRDALWLGEFGEAEMQARDAWRGSADPVVKAQLASDLADALVAQRRHTEALALLGGALDTPGLDGRTRGTLFLSAARCQVRVGRKTRDTRNIDNALALVRNAVALLEQSSAADTDAVAALVDALLLAGHPSQALGSATTLAPRLRSGTTSALAQGALAVARVRMSQLRFSSALWWSKRALALWRTILPEGTPPVVEAEVQAAIASWRSGALDDALDRLRRIVDQEHASLRRAAAAIDRPDAWARLRPANDAAEMLAALLWERGRRADRSEVHELLLRRRGSARLARITARRGFSPEIPAGLGEEDVLVALLPLHPLRPLDPMAGWDVEREETRLMMVTRRRAGAAIEDLGEWDPIVSEISKWRGLARTGRPAPLPDALTAVARTCSGAGRVVLLGDGLFETLPWGLILDPPQGILIALADASRAAGRVAGAETALLIMTSDFDPGSAPILEELAAAGSRATHVRTLYGSEATIAGVLTEAAGAQQLHMIAHGLEGVDTPAAPFNPYEVGGIRLEDGMLLSSEVAGIDGSRLGLVVLAGCSTARGVRQFGEGGASIAAAFIDAGAALVLGSIWDVPDQDTAAFMTLFYEALQDDAVTALRRAQRQARENGMRPSGWAGWICYCPGVPPPSPGSAKQAKTAQ